ncbi:hypothetical protein [Roseateles saccharophilus]|uniref:Uncharacterized protein n=1 Tax=Roseateles saccharophilus TaxID=304 RepID=A0A4R3VF82_ROSSA|nr:hypothetical protein [Roseateles saccharophilus]MDG0832261.1 hypothetical protein [Roseateles saccharophilus]TCV02364.1 hypothetical protein EV671_1004137 [Roseateles saccharophilus]
MNFDSRLLALIGRRLPAIFDVIPRGPQAVAGLQDRLAELAINPQPLPPGPPERLGAALAQEFAHMAWVADRLGANWKSMAQDLDDWCPTAPRKIKLPVGWPPIPEPEPHPNWLAELHLGFAAKLASISAEHAGSNFAATLDRAVGRSVDAISQLQMPTR